MKAAHLLSTHAQVRGVSGVRLLKVLEPDEALSGAYPFEDVLVWGRSAATPFAGGMGDAVDQLDGVRISHVRTPEAIRPGDVLRVRENSSQVSIVYRRGSTANTLFVTERCNSLCVMCSQPPRDVDDSWRLDELHRTIELIDRDEVQIGFSGGEPTLFGHGFAKLLAHARSRLPETHLHVLTNGRKFEDTSLASALVEAGGRQTVWAVPLYADVASIHDAIVGAPGAFEETIRGLGNLAQLGGRVEIRTVLHAASVPRLRDLSAYIYRRLPFVEHVAFMGLEPMGLARVNREQLWVDPIDFAEELSAAVCHLSVRGMRPSVYNLPHCVLPPGLWQFARASISDWKNRDDPACATCSVSNECSGFFRSADSTWKSRAIAPILDRSFANELA